MTPELQAKIDDVLHDIEAGRTTLESVGVYVDGVPAIIQAAVDAATAAGATPEQIQPMVDAGNILEAKAAEILQKIQTPGPTPPSTSGRAR